MGPKKLFVIMLTFLMFGTVVRNLLTIFGFTGVTVIEGGQATALIAILADVMSMIGIAMLLFSFASPVGLFL